MINPAVVPQQGPQQDTKLELQRLTNVLRGIVEGFEAEAMNGVICTPPSTEYGGVGWADEPNRTWCSRCRARWATLRDLPNQFAALSASRIDPPVPSPGGDTDASDEMLTLATIIDKRIYPTTPTVRVLARDYLRLRAAAVVPSPSAPEGK